MSEEVRGPLSPTSREVLKQIQDGANGCHVIVCLLRASPNRILLFVKESRTSDGHAKSHLSISVTSGADPRDTSLPDRGRAFHEWIHSLTFI